MRIPGVQKPHWSAWWRRNASWSGVSVAVAREPLDRDDLGAVDLHREEEARAHGDAVEPHRARAADAVLAADVRPGEAELCRRKSERSRRGSTSSR